jgi:hypothetical protein
MLFQYSCRIQISQEEKPHRIVEVVYSPASAAAARREGEDDHFNAPAPDSVGTLPENSGGEGRPPAGAVDRLLVKCVGLLLILAGIVLAVSGATTVIIGGGWLRVGTGLAMVAVPAWGLLAVYGWAFGRSYFDLVRQDRDDLS